MCTVRCGGREISRTFGLRLLGQDVNAAIEWLDDKPQAYYETPFWDGNMEACNFKYTVPGVLLT
jgi:hypothetical protein